MTSVYITLPVAWQNSYSRITCDRWHWKNMIKFTSLDCWSSYSLVRIIFISPSPPSCFAWLREFNSFMHSNSSCLGLPEFSGDSVRVSLWAECPGQRWSGVAKQQNGQYIPSPTWRVPALAGTTSSRNPACSRCCAATTTTTASRSGVSWPS